MASKSARPERPSAATWHLRCPLCRSPVEAGAGQEGSTVHCEDCHSPVLVVNPASASASRDRPRRLGPSSVEDPADGDDLVTEFRLGDAIPTPRYIPSPADGVDAIALYGEKPAPGDVVGLQLPGTSSAEPTPDVAQSDVAQSDVAQSDVAQSDVAQSESTVGIHCSLCHTRIHIPVLKVGQQVRCPDCHSQFTARLSKQVKKKSAAAPPPHDDVEFRLSEAVPVPKFQPLVRGTVTREQLDAAARSRKEGRSQSDSKASETSRAPPQGPHVQRPDQGTPSPQIDVVCPWCQSRLAVLENESGTTIVCGDCHNPFQAIPVRKRAARKLEAISEEELADLAVSGAGTVEGLPRGDRDEARRLYRDASDHDAERQPAAEIATLRKKGELRKLFEFLMEPDVLIRSVVVAFTFTGMAGLLLQIVTMMSSENRVMWAFSSLLCVAASAAAVMTWIFGASVAMTILQDTSEEFPKIESWPEGGPGEWLFQGAQILFAIAGAGCVASILVMALSSLPIPAAVMVVLWLAVFFFLFPIVLLSILEGESLLSFFSQPVVRTLSKSGRAWRRFYMTAALLALGVGLCLWGIAAGLGILFWILTPLLTVAGLIYFRAIGLLAARLSNMGGDDGDKATTASDL